MHFLKWSRLFTERFENGFGGRPWKLPYLKHKCNSKIHFRQCMMVTLCCKLAIW
uniref:Uncharacterized protein n=1 Tax=Anguilla anguilla TaxID=7936 RepID=A0A0E9XJ63_ANGAN